MFVWEEWAGKEGFRRLIKFQVSALVAFLVIDLDGETFTNIIDVFYRSPTDHCATMMQRVAEGKTPINTSTPAKR